MAAQQYSSMTSHSDSGRTPLFDDFARNIYLPFAREHKRSWKTDERYLNQYVLSHLGSLPLSAISKDVLKLWLLRLEGSGLAPSSCYRIFWLVKYMLNCAVRWHILADDSAYRDAVFQRTPYRRPELLSSAEVLKLIHMLKARPDSACMQAIYLLLLTGAGKSEILNARWEDVDLARGVLRTRKTFTGRNHLIPLSSEAVSLIRSLPRRPDVPWLFSTSRGSVITSLYYAWNSLRLRLGRPELRLQDLRHSFARFFVNMGMQQTELLSIMGHYKPETIRLIAKKNIITKEKV